MTGEPSPEVLCVSSENWLGLAQLPRLLALAGFRVGVMALPGSYLAASCVPVERLESSPSADETLERLRRHLEARRYDWVILGDDAVLDAAARRGREPWLAGLLPIRRPGAAPEVLISKIAFSRAMAGCGVAMSPARSASAPAELRAAAEALGYPVIVKRDRGWGGGGVFSARSVEELAAHEEEMSGDLIVERLIGGRVGGTAVLYDAGEPAWWASFYKVGVWPPPFGASCRRLPCEPAGLEPLLGKIGSALGLHGLFGVDWIETPAGELIVIELNGRPIPMAESNPGMKEELAAALRDFLAGRRARRPPTSARRGPVCHSLPESFSLACRDGEWLLAGALLLGRAGPTNVPWHDFGLLKRHPFRMARAAASALSRFSIYTKP